ncbi:MAG: hypothetical protein ABFC57_06340 [Veillonellales bacterium]
MINTFTINRTRLDIKDAHTRYQVKLGKKQILDDQFAAALEKEQKAVKQLEVFEKVTILLQKTSEFARRQAKTRIEEIVTSALSVVYGTDYKFYLELNVRANRPEVDYFLQSGNVITQLKPPDYDRGGGVVDVVTLALRLAIAELEGVQGTLFLDEVGKHISAEYSQNVAYFLREYSDKFNRQAVLITHNENLAAAGKRSFAVRQINGVSEVKVL